MITNKEKILSNHLSALSGHYQDLQKYSFNEPYFIDGQDDSVVSNSLSKKVAYITRHLLTCEVTHAIILDKEWYSRL